MDISKPDTSAKGRSIGVSLISLFALVLVVYLGFFGAILLDDLVLGTSFLSRSLPQPCVEVLKVIYAPLIWFVKWTGVV